LEVEIFSQRYIPISAVHAAFTAGLVHLVDMKDPHNSNSKKSSDMLRLLVNSLYKMNLAWFWCNRSIMVIESLAEHWGVGLREEGQTQHVNEESLRSFERYKLLAHVSNPLYSTRDQEHFQPSTSENASKSTSSSVFGLDLEFFDLRQLYDDFCVPDGQMM
jgi:hypothetical protein